MAAGDSPTPDPKQPLRLTHGNTARQRARGRGARKIFHGTLAGELNDRGAATVDELYLRFDCFLLPLEKGEIRQVLESARREGLVAEVSDERDGYGEPIAEQWTTTEKGRKLSRPRSLALPDLGYLLIGERQTAVKAFDVGKTMLTWSIPLLALVGIERLEPGEAAKWTTFAGVGVLILWMFYYGIRGELDLRAAAVSWQRLEEQRPERRGYQLSWLRIVYLPAAILLAYAAAGLGLALGFPPPWLAATGVAAAVVLPVYLLFVNPMYKRWHDVDPARCKQEWAKRRRQVARSPVASP